MRFRSGAKSLASGALTSMEKPTRSGSAGCATSKPIRFIRSPRHSLQLKPSLTTLFSNSLIASALTGVGHYHVRFCAHRFEHTRVMDYLFAKCPHVTPNLALATLAAQATTLLGLRLADEFTPKAAHLL